MIEDKVRDVYNLLGDEIFYLADEYKGVRYYNLCDYDLLGYDEQDINCVYVAVDLSIGREISYCRVPYDWLSHGDYYLEDSELYLNVKQYNAQNEQSDDEVISSLPSTTISAIIYEMYNIQYDLI